MMYGDSEKEEHTRTSSISQMPTTQNRGGKQKLHDPTRVCTRPKPCTREGESGCKLRTGVVAIKNKGLLDVGALTKQERVPGACAGPPPVGAGERMDIPNLIAAKSIAVLSAAASSVLLAILLGVLALASCGSLTVVVDGEKGISGALPVRFCTSMASPTTPSCSRIRAMSAKGTGSMTSLLVIVLVCAASGISTSKEPSGLHPTTRPRKPSFV